MTYKVKKSHFYYISKDSILKSLVIYAISLAIMEVMNIIIWINYEDVIRTWLISAYYGSYYTISSWKVKR